MHSPNMPSSTRRSPRELVTASAIVLIWIVFFVCGAYAAYDSVRACYYAHDGETKQSMPRMP